MKFQKFSFMIMVILSIVGCYEAPEVKKTNGDHVDEQVHLPTSPGDSNGYVDSGPDPAGCNRFELVEIFIKGKSIVVEIPVECNDSVLPDMGDPDPFSEQELNIDDIFSSSV